MMEQICIKKHMQGHDFVMQKYNLVYDATQQTFLNFSQIISK